MWWIIVKISDVLKKSELLRQCFQLTSKKHFAGVCMWIWKDQHLHMQIPPLHLHSWMNNWVLSAIIGISVWKWPGGGFFINVGFVMLCLTVVTFCFQGKKDKFSELSIFRARWVLETLKSPNSIVLCFYLNLQIITQLLNFRLLIKH